ncbi:hypothetical protein VTG60DRAFT_4915 [Thermothelomyces hinnuleus]
MTSRQQRGKESAGLQTGDCVEKKKKVESSRGLRNRRRDFTSHVATRAQDLLLRASCHRHSRESNSPGWRRLDSQSEARRLCLLALWGEQDMTSLRARIRLACFDRFLSNVEFPDQSRNCPTFPCPHQLCAARQWGPRIYISATKTATLETRSRYLNQNVV